MRRVRNTRATPNLQPKKKVTVNGLIRPYREGGYPDPHHHHHRGGGGGSSSGDESDYNSGSDNDNRSSTSSTRLKWKRRYNIMTKYIYKASFFIIVIQVVRETMLLRDIKTVDGRVVVMNSKSKQTGNDYDKVNLKSMDAVTKKTTTSSLSPPIEKQSASTLDKKGPAVYTGGVSSGGDNRQREFKAHQIPGRQQEQPRLPGGPHGFHPEGGGGPPPRGVGGGEQGFPPPHSLINGGGGMRGGGGGYGTTGAGGGGYYNNRGPDNDPARFGNNLQMSNYNEWGNDNNNHRSSSTWQNNHHANNNLLRGGTPPGMGYNNNNYGPTQQQQMYPQHQQQRPQSSYHMQQQRGGYSQQYGSQPYNNNMNRGYNYNNYPKQASTTSTYGSTTSIKTNRTRPTATYNKTAIAKKKTKQQTPDAPILITKGLTVSHKTRLELPTAFLHMADTSSPWKTKSDVPFFWDVHLGGGTIVERLYGKCFNLTQTSSDTRGLVGGVAKDAKSLKTLVMNGKKYLNVDTITPTGIKHASKLNLTSSIKVDIIYSPMLHDASRYLFTSRNRGRMFALFRHPVKRAISMYYYLQNATWDPLYGREIRNMTLVDYSTSRFVENNWLTRFLTNKMGGRLKRIDVKIAKEIIERKCLIGLMEDLRSSLRRFEKFFGWEVGTDVKQCREDVLKEGDSRIYYAFKDNIDENSTAYKNLLSHNRYDMEVYKYAREVYAYQKKTLFGNLRETVD